MSFTTLRASVRSTGVDSGAYYFDHNATTPIASAVASQVPSWLAEWGNPSSIHQVGRGPKALLRQARDRFASLIGAQPLEVVFTSGGSESNNFALKGVFEYYKTKTNALLANALPGGSPRNRYVVSSVEHPSVIRTIEALRERGAEVIYLPVSRSGAIDLESYRRLLDGQTALVSVMAANNETGTIFPIAEMAQMAHEVGALFHSDCVQMLGKIPIDVRKLGVDLATFSGHKFYSLKGVGALFVRRGTNLESLVQGGGQERHRRGGTENVLAIASLGKMSELKDEIAARGEEMKRLRDHLERRVLHEISGVSVTAGESPRLPNTTSLVIKGVDGETLLMNLDMRGFAVSTGAACSSGSPEPSPVLLAMGLSRYEAQSSLRLSIGWETSEQEVNHLVEVLGQVIAHLRKIARQEDPAHVNAR